MIRVLMLCWYCVGTPVVLRIGASCARRRELASFDTFWGRFGGSLRGRLAGDSWCVWGGPGSKWIEVGRALADLFGCGSRQGRPGIELRRVRGSGRIQVGLRSNSCRVGVSWGSGLGRFGFKLGLTSGRRMVEFGPLRSRCGVDLGSGAGRLRVRSASRRGRFRADAGAEVE